MIPINLEGNQLFFTPGRSQAGRPAFHSAGTGRPVKTPGRPPGRRPAGLAKSQAGRPVKSRPAGRRSTLVVNRYKSNHYGRDLLEVAYRYISDASSKLLNNDNFLKRVFELKKRGQHVKLAKKTFWVQKWVTIPPTFLVIFYDF